MNQGTKIVAVVLFVLFVGTGIYYVTLSPAKPASPSATKAPAPAAPRDPGAITMNPPTATGGQSAGTAPRIADPLASTGSTPVGSNPGIPSAVSSATPNGSAVTPGSTSGATAGANPSRVALGPSGTPSAVMPPLTVSRPSAGGVVGAASGTANGPASSVSGGTAPGVPAVRPTSPAATSTAATAPAASSSSAREHVVASGETLSSIAAKYLGSEARWEEIAKANPGVNPNSMRVGTKLSIPAGTATAKAGGTPSPSVGTDPAPSTTAANSTSDREYVVKAGDTLSAIARQTLGNADWEAIYEANRSVIGPNPAALKVGMKLAIPKRS